MTQPRYYTRKVVEIEEAYRKLNEAIYNKMQEYIEILHEYEKDKERPYWKRRYSEWNVEEWEIAYDEETLIIRAARYRQGDSDTETLNIPMSCLWDDNWKAELRAELSAKMEKKKEKNNIEKEKKRVATKKAKEERDYKRFLELKARFEGGSNENVSSAVKLDIVDDQPKKG